MLTTPCSGWDEDKALLSRWGLRGLRAFEDEEGRKIDGHFVEEGKDGEVRLKDGVEERVRKEGGLGEDELVASV